MCPHCGRPFDPADKNTFRSDWHYPGAAAFGVCLQRLTYIPLLLFLIGLCMAMNTPSSKPFEVLGCFAIAIWCGCMATVVLCPIVLTLYRRPIPWSRLGISLCILLGTVILCGWLLGETLM